MWKHFSCVAFTVAATSRATLALSLPTISRTRFLSSAAATFISSASILAVDPSSCDAMGSKSNKNPRYLDQELEMQADGVNPRSRGMLVRRFTGDSTPYSFPVKPIRLVKEWPTEPPFDYASDFSRQDEKDDQDFYTVPRLVYHIDEPAVSSLTQYYRNNIAPGSDILDICSSWVSHYPMEFPKTMKRISASGMNPLELKFNDQLTDFEAKNLNKDATLPYPDKSFDVVTCVVSIDYLNKPIQVLKEVHRVLKPGGKMIISQSNRCFPSKAIKMWLSMNDRQHLELINGYFQYAGGFKERKAFDITATVPLSAYRDPMFIVEAAKE